MVAYCVLCRGHVPGSTQSRRTIRFYLSAASAERALIAAADENPGFRVLGIEPCERASVAAA
jgi:hypothetical protein